ncbi:MAG: RNA-processing protein [Candidatus Aenigmarchaeota archaeon]|nr:RNA-processing protein [Candidatus Aenigmarchaeota archaeon]
MVMIKNIKIPEERLPVLIGRNGMTRKSIEKKTKTKIDAGEEEVIIEGESIGVLDAENIIKAIGRGFSPESAELLLNEENALMIIDLPRGEKNQRRVKSRLIGTKGKSRRNIERLTGTRISVYGKTVSLIGKYENVALAEQAIQKIIKGVPHRFVYEFLEARQNERT